MQKIILDIQNSSNAKNIIKNNTQKIKEYLKLDISSFNTTQIKFLMLNPNFNLKCSCNQNKKWLRNKFLATCGSKECIKNSTKQSSIEKYGVTHPTKLKETQDKKNKTNIEKYGEKHVLQNKDVKNKQEQTMFDKYGSKFALQNKDIKNKQEQTVQLKFNTSNVFSSEIIKDKIKLTNTVKYGFEYASQNIDIKNKQSKTFRNKYQNNSKLLNKDYIESEFIDTNNNFKVLDFMSFYNYSTNCAPYKMFEIVQEFKQFLTKSNSSQIFIKQNYDKISKVIKSYGLDINTLSTTEIRFLIINYPYDLKCPYCSKNKKFGRNKYYKTCGDKECNRLSASKTTLERFGVTNASKSELIKQKKEETCLKNYGVKNPNQSTEIRSKSLESYKSNNIQNSNLLNKEYIELNFIDDNNRFKVLDFIKFYGYSNDCAPYRILREMNISFTKLTKTSHQEKEVLKFIQGLTTSQILSNDREILKPLELDIFIPDYNLAIEYNGLYWHSYGLINTSDSQGDIISQQTRHINKTKQFETLSNNHQLFHIFENEWNNEIKQDIWKSIIKDKFKLNQRVYARDTIIKEVSSEEANQFIFENHIQGIRNAQIRLGLYKDDELLSIMTFGKPFNKTECEYELIRFCNKKYLSVVGGASKLLKHFEKKYKPKSLLSYANRRWSKGNLYHKLGFELQNISKPNKFIINLTDKTLHNRLEFQKHKLKDKLESYNPNLSANQNIINNNYRIIWDCGNYVFTKHYQI